MNLPTSSSLESEDLSNLVHELRELGFDAIRFASYRTAAKLRYIQKKSFFYLVDIWNVIEGIRENGLNVLDPYSIITVPKLESVVTSLYVNLNKRLPAEQQVDVYGCSRYLLSWLLIAYDSEGSGRARVFSAKIGLVTLCSGKLMDKLRYFFAQMSDAQGYLVLSRFSEFLEEILAMPAMVLESPTFGYTEGLASSIFEADSKITMHGFLDAIMSEPGPPCLMWLPLLHSMASVEEVTHGIQCNVCKIENIQGFRYKCQKCSGFNMCQDCFWQGKTAENHSTDHEVKEYITNKSSGRGFRDSFRKSFKCVPEKSKKMPKFPDPPEKPLNLSHIVPPSPLPVHNGFGSYGDAYDAFTDQKLFALELGQIAKRSSSGFSDTPSESDEEHRLISRYTARLASETKYKQSTSSSYHPMQHSRMNSQTSMHLFDSTRSQRDLIAQLEAKNREILHEIAQLRAQQELHQMNGEEDPVLYEELQALRYHKTELEDKLNNLQDSRKHLMGQLEGLMRMLKAQQITPKSTPNSSPHAAILPPTQLGYYPSGYHSSTYSHHRSAPSTPHHHPHNSGNHYGTWSSELRSAYSISDDIHGNGSSSSTSTVVNDLEDQSLRQDLLLAADSVTNAMSSLVKELNGSEEVADGHIMKPLGMGNGKPRSGGMGRTFN